MKGGIGWERVEEGSGWGLIDFNYFVFAFYFLVDLVVRGGFGFWDGGGEEYGSRRFGF